MTSNYFENSKPIITYYGGKQRIAKKIVNVIKTIPHKVYAEPFAGGLAVLFKKGVPYIRNQSNYIEAINDTDSRLINLYKILQDEENRKLFLSKLKYTPYSESEHILSKQILKDRHQYPSIDLAWAYYVNIQQGFASQLNSGWGRGKTINNASVWNNKKDVLDPILDRFRSVQIACCDALKFIKHYDSDQTLFYLDPPYPGTNQSHYSGYTQVDFEKLIDLLKCIKGNFILSGYHNRSVPNTWEEIKIEASMSAARDKTVNRSRTEILWVKRSGESEGKRRSPLQLQLPLNI